MTERRLVVLLAAAALGGCGGAGRVAPEPRDVKAGATFVLTVSEAVASPEEDVASYVKVYVNGQLAGQTPPAPKSREKAWGDALPPGNHLFRLEAWAQPAGGDWAALDAQWQPPERFIRVEPGQRTTAALKLTDGGRRHSLQLSREPL